jgi:ribosome-associated translation inhibitor RaiA
VVFDAHHYDLSKAEEQWLRDNLDGLSRQVEHFPVADLHVHLNGNARSNNVSVKLVLVLPGTTLVMSDHDAIVSPAFDRCLESLLDSLHAYKNRLGDVAERQKTVKGTHQELHPSIELDADALALAVETGDYLGFRTTTFPFEEGVRKRVGRWIQRYPRLESRLGSSVSIDDLVEEVFLLAFDRHARRPAEVPLSDWLESLVDPAVRALQNHPEKELESIHLARTALAAAQENTPSPDDSRLRKSVPNTRHEPDA